MSSKQHNKFEILDATVELFLNHKSFVFKRHHWTISYQLTQVITEKGCFVGHLCLIRKQITPERHHCDGQAADMALHT